MKVFSILVTAFVAAIASVGAEVGGSSTNSVAIKAGHLLDVTSGKALQHQVILVEGEVIKSIGAERDVSIPAAATVIDLGLAWVLPGLIDCHTHLTSQIEDYYADTFRKSPIDYAVETHVFARRTLEAGFTSCRDVGSAEFIDIALKRAIAAGKVVGPRLACSHTAKMPRTFPTWLNLA